MSWEGCWKKGGEACGTSSQEEKRRGRVEGQKSPKIEKMAILSGKLAILGHFSRFSPNDHLDTCFNDQQDFMF